MQTVNPKVFIPALALVTGLTVQVHTVVADNPPDLPHAFDAGWEGQKTCEILFEDDSVRVARCVFPPGIGHEKHYHNPHFGYVLETGSMQLTDSKGQREVTTKSGTNWSTTEVTVHEALNTGETTTSYLVVESKGQ
jgi:quercetin dioxygenase-like cupin family protein